MAKIIRLGFGSLKNLKFAKAQKTFKINEANNKKRLAA